MTASALDLDVVGTVAGPVPVSWTDTDTLLYALAVGAGQQDPLAELQLTTENTDGCRQMVLPTFAVGLIHYRGPSIDIGAIDASQRLHAEQSVEVRGVLSAAGAGAVTTTVSGIYDKGSGALVVFESELTDEAGAWIARSRSASFIRGAGGFGGDRGNRSEPTVLDRDPDVLVTAPTRRDQALLYRLCGDRNPLHADPAIARRGGFDRPILHGLCSYGITCRLLIGELAGGDVGRMRSIGGRFTRTVLPGETLTVAAWASDNGAVFQLRNAAGLPVIDRGVFEYE